MIEIQVGYRKSHVHLIMTNTELILPLGCHGYMNGVTGYRTLHLHVITTVAVEVWASQQC